MGGKTTNSSNIFFLLTPMGSSHLSMRETPDETTPGCSVALHHTPSHQGCSRNHRSPHSPSPTASAATSHPSDVSPKSRCVQRAGGLLEYRGHFSTVQPDQQPTLAGMSSPYHQRKGLLCSLLYHILLATIFATEGSQEEEDTPDCMKQWKQP